MALKRQQAVEDAIALRLVATKTGQNMDCLPPGNIFDLAENLKDLKSSNDKQQQETVEDLSLPSKQIESSPKLSVNVATATTTTTPTTPTATATILQTFSATTATKETSKVSQNAIDMLAQLFPQRKRSVLELVLKRCDSDLVKAIENISSSASQVETDMETSVLASSNVMKSAFKPVYSSGNMVSSASLTATLKGLRIISCIVLIFTAREAFNFKPNFMLNSHCLSQMVCASYISHYLSGSFGSHIATRNFATANFTLYATKLCLSRGLSIQLFVKIFQKCS